LTLASHPGWKTVILISVDSAGGERQMSLKDMLHDK